MHEMGIARQIIDIVTHEITGECADRAVLRIHIKVGKLTAVSAESLRFCFGIMAQDTALSSAALDIEEEPIVGRCRACSLERVFTEPVFVCTGCGNGSIEITSGRQLDVVSVEIEDIVKRI